MKYLILLFTISTLSAKTIVFLPKDKAPDIIAKSIVKTNKSIKVIRKEFSMTAFQKVRNFYKYDKIIGGLHSQIELLEYAKKNPNLKVVLLSNKTKSNLLPRNVVRGLPQRKRIARSIISIAKKMGYYKLAYIGNAKLYSQKFFNHLKSEGQASGVNLDQNLHYKSFDYQSLNIAIRSLLQNKPSDRPAEFRALYKRNKLLASSNANTNAVLSPKMDFDALIIADQVSSVRQVVNILKYWGVKRINLIGTPEWRAEALLHPKEPLLEGSFFVDYLDEYTNLPLKLSGISPYFTHPKRAERIDLKYLGYRIAVDDYNWTTHTYEVRNNMLRKIY